MGEEEILIPSSLDFHKDLTKFFFFLSLVFYFERAHKQGRGRERTPIRPHTVSTELKAGLDLMNCEIMT